MKNLILCIIIVLATAVLTAQSQIDYNLQYTPGSDIVSVEIKIGSMSAQEARLIIPRSAPGTYEITDYLIFVENVKGHTTSGEEIAGSVGDGSYFDFDSQKDVLKITYDVNVKRMENELIVAHVSSKAREGYLGMLGYSVFGYVEGTEDYPIHLDISTREDWPIYSTLAPTTDMPLGAATYYVSDYSLLADAQYLMGPDLQVLSVDDAPVPLYVAAYSETPIDMEEIGRRSLLSLGGLADYFGYVPMPHYTVFYEFLEPVSPRHSYGFSMEHLNSMSASKDVSKAVTGYDPDPNIGSVVHHIGHSWVPLRSYGVGYRPFEWQAAPLVETIWLHEGFIWYVAYYHVLDNPDIINRFKRMIKTAPPYIQSKTLKELSLLGSTQYGMDFRIGKNLFARGAMMAHELDLYIAEESNDKKSFKDAILGLLHWTAEHKRAFEYHEIPEIMSTATGVDISSVWDEWQLPTNR